MNTNNKRRDTMNDDKYAKRVKKECSYGDKCYRMNPTHFREFSHPHLESILDTHTGGDFTIPEKYTLLRHMFIEQLEMIVEKQLYVPKNKTASEEPVETVNMEKTDVKDDKKLTTPVPNSPSKASSSKDNLKSPNSDEVAIKMANEPGKRSPVPTNVDATSSKEKDPDYRPIVPPTRRIEEFLKVVAPKGKMAAKHAASAPYHIFYTTITDARETHTQPYSITFQELLDHSLGELRCSLQINFMVDPGWLLAQYYFAGYSNKKLTILYGEDSADLRSLSTKKPHVHAQLVSMATPFGKHHTKMMVLCYEDGSLRVVVSTANLYIDDWENRTQGLWLSPPCPELPADAMPHDGESPTMFKRCLLKYLNSYQLPQLASYVERVKRCDFTNINVFLCASIPGSHSDVEWGLLRAGALLRQHCAVPPQLSRAWPLVAQASSLGSYGAQPRLWLTGDFLHHMTRVKDAPNILSTPPQLQLVYPSLENVRQSHDGLLGGGCLPYSAEINTKQPWLVDYLHQWRATHSGRDRAMPHLKSYTRISPCSKMAAFYLLTSGNISKAAWGTVNKGNAALRIMSYEAGVMFLPKFVINKDFFPIEKGHPERLIIPYDLPPPRYGPGMTPWVSDYLM